MDSTKSLARRAGLLYGLACSTAPFAYVYVPDSLIVQNDAVATADRVRASENLLRVGHEPSNRRSCRCAGMAVAVVLAAALRTVHGRAAIEAFLSGFSGYRVLSNSVVPSSTQVTGDQAVQVGQYRQRVRTPDGKVLEVSGSFRAEWVRSGDQWLIQRMSTSPGGEGSSGS